MAEIIKTFLRLGFLGFGGPFAVIAMFEDEFVVRRKWLTAQKFAQSFSIIKVLPGATSTQMSIHIAYLRGGFWGGFVGGLCFLLPAAILVLLVTIFYVQVHEMPAISTFFQGMQIGALIVIADSVARMAKPYMKSYRSIAIALVAGVIIFIRPSAEPFVILGLGLYGILDPGFFGFMAVRDPNAAPLATSIFGTLFDSNTVKVALVCLKTGFLVFGTGLAVIPVLEADVVGKYHWLTHNEFLDGIAIGQITPGPVVTTATFIGYKVSGMSGAFWATVGIFTSAFVNILFFLPALEHKLKDSPKLKLFTDWAFPAVIGGIVATSIRLGITTVNSKLLVLCLLAFGFIGLRFRIPSWAFIPASGLGIFLASQVF